MIYQVQATVVVGDDSKSTTYQSPTFFLDGDIQGIMSLEHALRIVGTLLNPSNAPNIKVSAFIEPIKHSIGEASAI